MKMFKLALPLRHLRRISLILCGFCMLFLMAAYFRSSFNGAYPQLPLLHRFTSPAADSENKPDLNSVVKPTFCPEKLESPVGRIAIRREPLSWVELVVKYTNNATSGPGHLGATMPTNSTNPSPVMQNVTYPVARDQIPVGVWSPIECVPRQKLIIILPFRNRDEHLRIFLNHMHPFLRHQQLMYTIMVVEQLGTTRFNRAALFNVGFRESERIARFDCFVFHDVDLLPEDDRLPYRCGMQPIHLSASVDQHNYKLLYRELFGGAIALSRTQFERTRGFSNVFFGWGGEDDDLSFRVRHYGYTVFRHPSSIARYTMIKHNRDELNQANPLRYELLKNSSKRLSNDGYRETEYQIEFAGPKYGGLVYWLSVNLEEKLILEKFNLSSH